MSTDGREIESTGGLVSRDGTKPRQQEESKRKKNGATSIPPPSHNKAHPLSPKNSTRDEYKQEGWRIRQKSKYKNPFPGAWRGHEPSNGINIHDTQAMTIHPRHHFLLPSVVWMQNTPGRHWLANRKFHTITFKIQSTHRAGFWLRIFLCFLLFFFRRATPDTRNVWTLRPQLFTSINRKLVLGDDGVCAPHRRWRLILFFFGIFLPLSLELARREKKVNQRLAHAQARTLFSFQRPRLKQIYPLSCGSARFHFSSPFAGKCLLTSFSFSCHRSIFRPVFDKQEMLGFSAQSVSLFGTWPRSAARTHGAWLRNVVEITNWRKKKIIYGPLENRGRCHGSIDLFRVSLRSKFWGEWAGSCRTHCCCCYWHISTAVGHTFGEIFLLRVLVGLGVHCGFFFALPVVYYSQTTRFNLGQKRAKRNIRPGGKSKFLLLASCP